MSIKNKNQDYYKIGGKMGESGDTADQYKQTLQKSRKDIEFKETAPMAEAERQVHGQKFKEQHVDMVQQILKEEHEESVERKSTVQHQQHQEPEAQPGGKKEGTGESQGEG